MGAALPARGNLRRDRSVPAREEERDIVATAVAHVAKILAGGAKVPVRNFTRK